MLERYTDEELQDIAAQLLLEAIVEGRLDSDDEEIAHAQEVGLSLGLELGLNANRAFNFVKGVGTSVKRAPLMKRVRVLGRQAKRSGSKYVEAGKRLISRNGKVGFGNLGTGLAVGGGAGYVAGRVSMARPNSGNGIVKTP